MNNRQDLVSIVMPSYNSSKFVEESIDSIISQTYQNWELIIVDDFSNDGTPDILRTYANRDPRIKVFLMEQNNGAGFTRNKAIEEAKGRYIAFCDSDDRWFPTKLEKQISFMQAENVALCFAPYYQCDEGGKIIYYVPAPKCVNLFSTMCDDKIGFSTSIYDTSVCGKPYMPLQRKRQDYAYVLTLLQKCKEARSVEEPLVYYRISPQGISHNKWKLIKYNALTYQNVFGWGIFRSYCFLVFFFLPTYFWKKISNKLINLFGHKI